MCMRLVIYVCNILCSLTHDLSARIHSQVTQTHQLLQLTINIFILYHGRRFLHSQYYHGILSTTYLEVLALLLLGRVSADVLEGAQDVRRDWGRSGQVLARGPVTVGIGSPAQLVQLSLGVVVAGDAVGDVATESGLCVGDSVGGLEVVRVSAIGADVAVLLQDVRIPIDVGGRGQGQNGGENELSGGKG